MELFTSMTDSGVSSGKYIFEYISGAALKIKKTLEISIYKLKLSFGKEDLHDRIRLNFFSKAFFRFVYIFLQFVKRCE